MSGNWRNTLNEAGNQRHSRNAVAVVPIDYVLLETDGPYVKQERPEGIIENKWTKARNTSLILPDVASRIAEIKGIAAEDVLRTTEGNTKRVFGIE